MFDKPVETRDGMIQELREVLGPGTQVSIITDRRKRPPGFLLAAGDAHKKLGSIGKGIPARALRVVDENGAPVPPGQVREIVAEGDNVTLGYLNATEAASATFAMGVFIRRFGDVDDEGLFSSLTDRETFRSAAGKEFLQRGGSHGPRIGGLTEVVVIATPDDLLGEAVKAFVVP